MSLKQHYIELPDALFQSICPEQLVEPSLIIFNQELSEQLDLPNELRNCDVDYLSGNTLVPKSIPLALGYAGHQFGNLVPQLGDGRAHLLGQVSSKFNYEVDLQLKGSGKTRYSRGGDGKSTLRAALREYIISEYLATLNINTSRSLYVIAGNDSIMRNELEQVGLVCRVAKSHIRIGSFQYAAMHQDPTVLKSLADFTIRQLYPELLKHQNPYLSLVKQVAEQLAELVASWMANGFIHGVMNTDNILLSGETIDFGPCAFMGKYNPAQVFSSIDRQGRYAFQNQPSIMHWNLARFAESLITLVAENEDRSIQLLSSVLNEFPTRYETIYHMKLCEKLALSPNEPMSKNVIIEMLAYMKKEQLDYRETFSFLSMFSEDTSYQSNIVNSECFKLWQKHKNVDLIERMCHVNPKKHFYNVTIEKLLDLCVADPLQASNHIELYFSALKQNDYEFLQSNHSFDDTYRTYCGT
ncbi:protein adenylyltransferase SelO family protein [Pseudoalteromonas sp.]|uniref:protein adenylyltransferase SelO family protein n=1 Tax=Pseudoalteromonas sp. TaxID=53249 RepID=UPI003564EB90